MAQRDEESFNKHITDVVGNCCKSWIILKTITLLGPQFLLLPKKCKSNYCITCRRDNLLRLRRSMFASMKTDKWRLCTLTWPDHSGSVEVALKDSYSMFKRLTRQLRKIRNDLKYIRSIEVHKSGFIHIHCVFNKYIPISFISEKWKDVGGGIVDIRATKKCRYCHKPTPCAHTPERRKLGYRDAGRYLTEEMEKGIQDPHTLGYTLWKNRVRTIATSRNVQLKAQTNVYEFIGNYSSLTQAYHLFEDLEYAAEAKQNCTPSIHLGKSSVTFGYDGHFRNDPKKYSPFNPPEAYKLLKSIDEIRLSPIVKHRNENQFDPGF